MRLLPRVLAVALLLTVLVHATPAHAATRPSAPRSVTATPLDRAVKVSWAAPASTGGSRITAYAVQRRNSTSAAWVTVKFTAGGARTWTETGLVNGRRFYYRVLARNAVGTGTPSPQVSAVPRTVPAAVRFFEADNYDRALGAYWPAPASNGAAIDGYRVELSTDGATWTTARTSRVAASRTAPLKFTGLTPGGRYWLRIRPHNAAGYGPASGSGPYRAYTVPDAVGALTATPGDGTAALTWTAPVADPGIGRPAATSYVVERAVGATWAPVGTTTATGLVVGDLANGAEHVLRVRAFSAFAGIGGSLPATTTVQLAPGVVAPGAPGRRRGGRGGVRGLPAPEEPLQPGPLERRHRRLLLLLLVGIFAVGDEIQSVGRERAPRRWPPEGDEQVEGAGARRGGEEPAGVGGPARERRRSGRRVLLRVLLACPLFLLLLLRGAVHLRGGEAAADAGELPLEAVPDTSSSVPVGDFFSFFPHERRQGLQAARDGGVERGLADERAPSAQLEAAAREVCRGPDDEGE